jgi:hydrogenase nickel incorporation protein HypA/HybF
MHEFAIAAGVLQVALRHACGRRVTAVNVRIGPLRQLMPEALSLAFAVTAGGTPCEGAGLQQELIPCRLGCAAGATEWTPAELDFRCKRCGWPAAALSCDELQVESIEVA